MPRAPRLTGGEIVAALRRAGWSVDEVHGSHHQLRHPDQRGVVTVPVHGRDVVHPKTLRSILLQANMTTDELRDLL